MELVTFCSISFHWFFTILVTLSLVLAFQEEERGGGKHQSLFQDRVLLFPQPSQRLQQHASVTDSPISTPGPSLASLTEVLKLSPFRRREGNFHSRCDMSSDSKFTVALPTCTCPWSWHTQYHMCAFPIFTCITRSGFPPLIKGSPQVSWPSNWHGTIFCAAELWLISLQVTF